MLAAIGGTWEPAIVTGTLHQDGWGSALGSPVIILDDQGYDVEGFIFISEHLSNHWAVLDEFEGEEYERTLITVTSEGGSKVESYIYALRIVCVEKP